MIMLADQTQLTNLKKILTLFSTSTGLHVNYHKTTLAPINIDHVQAQSLPQSLAQSFGCKD
jgi:hypothetical protein